MPKKTGLQPPKIINNLFMKKYERNKPKQKSEARVIGEDLHRTAKIAFQRQQYPMYNTLTDGDASSCSCDDSAIRFGGGETIFGASS
jgi:hypothetical protein